MMNKLGRLLIVCALTAPSVAKASEASLSFYDGTLGTQHIGLTLQIPDSVQPGSRTPIEKVSYFYATHLHDIPLKIVNREGLRLTLEEDDASGVPIAILHLEFAVDRDDLAGTWESADGQRTLPIKLSSQYQLTSENGGLCGMDAAKTKHLEDRVRAFQIAFLKTDVAQLKRAFKYNLPRNSRFRPGVADSMAHDMFCRDVGVLFGSFWFDYQGNLINPPR